MKTSNTLCRMFLAQRDRERVCICLMKRIIRYTFVIDMLLPMVHENRKSTPNPISCLLSLFIIRSFFVKPDIFIIFKLFNKTATKKNQTKKNQGVNKWRIRWLLNKNQLLIFNYDCNRNQLCNLQRNRYNLIFSH